jgi:hypothetical protein
MHLETTDPIVLPVHFGVWSSTFRQLPDSGTPILKMWTRPKFVNA